MYSVYVLEDTVDLSWYIGFTTNLRRRLKEHKEKRGGATTKSKTSWKLIYYESYANEKDARGREKFLKSGSGRKFLKKQLANYLKKNY